MVGGVARVRLGERLAKVVVSGEVLSVPLREIEVALRLWCLRVKGLLRYGRGGHSTGRARARTQRVERRPCHVRRLRARERGLKKPPTATACRAGLRGGCRYYLTLLEAARRKVAHACAWVRLNKGVPLQQGSSVHRLGAGLLSMCGVFLVLHWGSVQNRRRRHDVKVACIQ